MRRNNFLCRLLLSTWLGGLYWNVAAAFQHYHCSNSISPATRQQQPHNHPSHLPTRSVSPSKSSPVLYVFGGYEDAVLRTIDATTAAVSSSSSTVAVGSAGVDSTLLIGLGVATVAVAGLAAYQLPRILDEAEQEQPIATKPTKKSQPPTPQAPKTPPPESAFETLLDKIVETKAKVDKATTTRQDTNNNSATDEVPQVPKVETPPTPPKTSIFQNMFGATKEEEKDPTTTQKENTEVKTEEKAQPPSMFQNVFGAINEETPNSETNDGTDKNQQVKTEETTTSVAVAEQAVFESEEMAAAGDDALKEEDDDEDDEDDDGTFASQDKPYMFLDDLDREERRAQKALDTNNMRSMTKSFKRMSRLVQKARDETNKERDLREQVANQLESANKEIQKANDRYDVRQGELTKTRGELEGVKKELSETKDSLQNAQTQIKKLEGEKESLRKLGKDAFHLMGRRVTKPFRGRRNGKTSKSAD